MDFFCLFESFTIITQLNILELNKKKDKTKHKCFTVMLVSSKII